MGLKLKGPKVGGTIGKIANTAKKTKLEDVAIGGLAGGAGVAAKSITRQNKEAKQAKGNPNADAEAAALSARYEGERNTGRSALEQTAGRAIPTVSAPTVDPFWMEKQKGLVSDLEARSRGEGQSLAQMQFQQAGNTALQKSLGAIRAATGANPALAGRTAALAGSSLMGNLAAESGMARLQEQQQAQAALAQLLAQGRAGSQTDRGQDIGVSEANARLASADKAATAAIQGGLLSDTEGFYGNIYDRGLRAKQGQGGGGNADLWKTLVPAAATVAGSMMGGPAGGAAAGAATSMAMPVDESGQQGPYRLTDTAPQKKTQFNQTYGNAFNMRGRR